MAMALDKLKEIAIVHFQIETFVCDFLRDLDGRKDQLAELQRAEEADRARQTEEDGTEDSTVRKVHECANRIGNRKLGCIVEHAVSGEVERARATGEERTPVPRVRFVAQLKVNENNCDLRARHDQNEENDRLFIIINIKI